MGIRILVVDDMPIITSLISEYLMDQGYEAISAENGQEALELMEVSPVSLVVSDVMMPKMGGFEFIEKCRQFYPKVPIIVVSAKQDNQTRSMVTELGANGFLEKPINLEVLSKLISSTLSAQMKKIVLPEPDFESTRKYLRVPFFCEASFKGETISGVTIITSISRAGCNLEIQSALSIGAILSIKIKLYPGHTINVDGSVCYSIPKSGIGVRFIELDEESGRLIDNIVTSVSKLGLFDLEYRDNTGKLIDTFVDKFDVLNQENKDIKNN